MRSRYSLITVMVILLAGCETFTPKEQALVILADRTEADIPKPTLEDIRSVVDTDTDPNMGLEVYYQHIGATDYNKRYQLSLPAVSILENTHQRDSDTKRFYKQLDSLFNYENSKAYTYKSSNVLFPLLKQLRALQSKKAVQTTVLLYSDLIEYSDVYDSYGQTQLLMDSPVTVAQTIALQLEVPKLSNTTLYVIFEPKTKRKNRLFRSWLEVYAHLFKDSGITIRTGLPNTWEHE